MNSLSLEEENRRLSLYRQGLNDRQISRRLDLNFHTVKSWRQSRGLIGNGWSLKILRAEDEIIRLYRTGVSESQIGRDLGFPQRTISYLLRSKGLPTLRRYSTSRDLTIAERAYLAGLIDGEGTIYSSRLRSGLVRTLSIYNTDEEVILWVHQVIGQGSVSKQAKRTPSGKRTKPLYSWRAYANTARWVLRQAYPYLIIKKGKAKEFLDEVGWEDPF